MPRISDACCHGEYKRGGKPTVYPEPSPPPERFLAAIAKMHPVIVFRREILPKARWNSASGDAEDQPFDLAISCHLIFRTSKIAASGHVHGMQVPVRITVILRTVPPSKTDDVKVRWVRIFDVEKTLI